jgi:hypothetical protein
MAVMISPGIRTFVSLGLICLAQIARAESSPSPIRDEAGLLNSDTRARAEKTIVEIRRDFDRNLFVRTVDSASPQKRPWYNFLKTPKVYRTLEEKAREYAAETGQAGIYLVVCRRPRAVQIVVIPNDEPLRRALQRRLHEGRPESNVIVLMNRVQNVLREYEARGPSPADNDVLLLGCLGGGIALWILLLAIHWKLGLKSTPSQEKAPLLTPALLGAIFGFPTGAWINDKIYLEDSKYREIGDSAVASNTDHSIPSDADRAESLHFSP